MARELWFRHADPRFPFLSTSADQPPARWHGTGEGPVQYLASTPDGAWAELLRHEEITEPADLAGVRRALWAVEVDLDAESVARPRLLRPVLSGGAATYPPCRDAARRARARGRTAIRAPQAALLPRGAGGRRVQDGKLVAAPGRDGETLALFGDRPGLRGWLCQAPGGPPPDLLDRVRPLPAMG